MSKPQLVRRLGFTSATTVVVSNMVGTGIFTTSGFLAGDLGSPTLVIGIWFVGALVALVGALCYSELGINFQRSGGEYVYLSEAWGPAWGFIDGWVSFFAGFSAPIAVATLAIAAYLAHFNPALDPTNAVGVASLGPITIYLGGGQLLACSLVAVFTLLNVLGVEQIGRMQNGLTGLKLAVLAAFLLLGFSVGTGDWTHFSQAAERTSESSLSSQFAVSLVFVYFGYSGWNAAVYVAEELRDPERTLPFALLAGTTLVVVLYVALNCLFIYATPLEEMKGVVAVGAQAAESLFGPTGGGIFAAGMALSLLATVNAMSLIGPRVYYAMARDKAFFPIAARVHPRWKSPWVAVAAQGLCCCVLILTGTFEGLLYYIGFTLWLFSAFAVLGLFKFRHRPGWKRLSSVSFAWPLLPTVFAATNVLVFAYFAVERSLEAVWSALTILVGVVIYGYLSKSGALGR